MKLGLKIIISYVAIGVSLFTATMDNSEVEEQDEEVPDLADDVVEEDSEEILKVLDRNYPINNDDDEVIHLSEKLLIHEKEVFENEKIQKAKEEEEAVRLASSEVKAMEEKTVAEVIEEVIPEPEPQPVVHGGVYGQEMSSDQYNTFLAVVQQESAGLDYTATLAVVSVITNRVDSGGFPNTVWGVITAPGQFEAYGAGHYTRHFGNITETTRQAVADGLNGSKNINLLFFWEKSYYRSQGRQDPEAVTIGGNTFFNW